MSKKMPKREQLEKEPRRRTPTVLLELPLVVNEGQAKRMRGHLEAGRALYNAVLSEGQKRLRRMRADPAWQAARSIPRTQQQERRAAFSALRQRYGFSEDALHEYTKTARVCWIADQLEAVIDWADEVIAHGLRQRIKYARLVQRRASSECAAGADARGFRSVVQLALEGAPHHKKKHAVGNELIGADLGPSTIALVPQAGEASLSVFCRVCMANTCIRSWRSATRSCWKRFRTKRGKSSMARVEDCEHQGCL